MNNKKTMETELQQQIKNVLSQFPSYWENNMLLNNKVIEDLRNYDELLIKALLSNELVKDTYSVQVSETTLFKTEDFIDVLRYKNYWENSYTKYTNQIGLTSEGKYLKYNTDVVLDFPHKDCVLEGGMTKEDVAKKEIYYNNVLAKEEIDTLLSPKVLSNIKKFDENGKHYISEFIDTDNLILKGNNLVALNSLKEHYIGRVKLIYIDPPYFFKEKKEEDTFNYNSNFHNSTWLTFMKNRLEIAKELLVEGGTIWISINEDGMHYLKVLADSVFGMDKFLGTTPRRTRFGKSDVPFNYSQDFDFLLAYSNVSDNNQVIGRSVDRQYYTSKDYPNRPWRLTDSTTQRNYIERPNSYFTMIDPKTKKEYPASKKRTWAVTKDTFNHYYDKGYIVFPDDYDFLNITKPYIRKFKDEDQSSGKLSSVISDFAIKEFLQELVSNSTNKIGNDELVTLLEDESFSYPKPESLIKAIIEIATKENDIVLDFFMGSGTTQAVAHKMGRQYIGIEQMDYIETVSVPRLQKVIEGEQGGISKDINWQGGGSFVYAELHSLNEQYISRIQEASDDETLNEVLEEIKDNAYLNFKVEFERLKTRDQSFQVLGLEEKKKILIQALDMNQLYLNYSEIEDTQHGISEEVKQFNHSFYQKEGEKND
ncbi:site-specific DNA-methyltransferase [Virgibacillus alimentarius]|uniref:site-specific DNA-methyltransferase n=1 Tax=Virgibacillus alimentarius TaxID=698769 RepID=UPI000A6D4664|nr:site-specific DNA-methyltransferase [Virgibacillus alimentarius]